MTSYQYQVARVIKVVDGDTYDLQLLKRMDFGFYLSEDKTWSSRFRLLGYDCPERTKGSAFEKSQAKVAAQVATEFFDQAVATRNATIWARSEKDPDDFGRWLVDVWLQADDDAWPERHLGAELRSHGLASLWPTRWRTEFDHGSPVE